MLDLLRRMAPVALLAALASPAQPVHAQARASAPRAAATAPATAPAGPTEVAVGVYVVDVTDFDVKSNSYQADFYLWMRWQGNSRQPQVEVMNGVKAGCEEEVKRDLPTEHYVQHRCQYRLHGRFDLARFPLDAHVLTLALEDKERETDSLAFVPDRAATGREPVVDIPGWEVGHLTLDTLTHVYRTSYGLPGRPPHEPSRYSRVVVSLPVYHAALSVYLKTFLVMFISVAVGLMGVLLPPEHVEARMGVGVAAMFGVVSSYLVLADNLPQTSQFTLGDQLHVAGMVFVALSILTSALMYRLRARLGDDHAGRWDQRAGVATALAFVALVAYLTVTA